MATQKVATVAILSANEKPSMIATIMNANPSVAMASPCGWLAKNATMAISSLAMDVRPIAKSNQDLNVKDSSASYRNTSTSQSSIATLGIVLTIAQKVAMAI